MAARKTPAKAVPAANADVLKRYANALLEASTDKARFDRVLSEMARDKAVRANDLKVIANAYLNTPSGGTHQYRFRSGKAAVEAIRNTFGERVERESKRAIINRITSWDPAKPASGAASALTAPEQALAKAIVANHPGHGQRLPLSKLRELVPSLSRQEFDQALISLQRKNLALLYQNDNRAMLTAAEKASALYIGGDPRHFVMGEAGQLERLKAALPQPAAKPVARATPKPKAPKSNPKVVEDLAARFKAAMLGQRSADAVAREIAEAKMSKADKLALAKATGTPSRATGADAIRRVTDRLRAVGSALAKAGTTGSRLAGAMALVAAGASLISMIAGGGSSGSALAAPAPKPDGPPLPRNPSQPLPPFEVDRVPSVGSGAAISPVEVQAPARQPVAYLNEAAQRRAESSPKARDALAVGARPRAAAQPRSDGWTEGYVRNGIRVRGYQTPQR